MRVASDSFVLSAGDTFVSETNLIWWVVPHNQKGCVISLASEGKETKIRLSPYESGILLLLKGDVAVRNGSVAVLIGDFTEVVKLQAFVDTSMACEKQRRNDMWYCFSSYRYKKNITPKVFESWILSKALHQDSPSETVISMLRSTECYWLVRFLLKTERTTTSLKELGKKYGLSASHFRRLTKNALGNTTKEELCNWRLARAILELMESDESITDIALKHGYASLSHFSNDVKILIGVPPRELKNKIFGDADK